MSSRSSEFIFQTRCSEYYLKLKRKVKKEKPVEPHIHSVLMNSKTGKMSPVGLRLNYKFTLRAVEALADHDYCTNKQFDRDTININPEKFSYFSN